jgi:DNA-binding transcriptional regulator YiaG
MSSLPVPDDLSIPTCNSCGTEWIDRPTATALDKALEERYQGRLRELAVADMDTLAALGITQQRLERLLGLSQGYLSKVRSGASRPSFTLASCLRLLAKDPEHRLREMEDWFHAA